MAANKPNKNQTAALRAEEKLANSQYQAKAGWRCGYSKDGKTHPSIKGCGAHLTEGEKEMLKVLGIPGVKMIARHKGNCPK